METIFKVLSLERLHPIKWQLCKRENEALLDNMQRIATLGLEAFENYLVGVYRGFLLYYKKFFEAMCTNRA